MNVYKLHIAVMELFYQQVLIVKGFSSTAVHVDYKFHSDDMLDALIFLKNYLKQNYIHVFVYV